MFKIDFISVCNARVWVYATRMRSLAMRTTYRPRLAALLAKLMGIPCLVLFACLLLSILFHLLRSAAQNCFTFKKFSETVHHLHFNW